MKNLRETILSILVLIIFAFSGAGTADSENSTDPEIQAWVCAEGYVERRLKSPSSAEFPWYDESSVQGEGGNVYSVYSYVDAQNSFGASVRTPFYVKVRIFPNAKNGERVCELIDIEI